jgi:hypothetical protein
MEIHLPKESFEFPVVIVGGIHGDEPAGNIAAKEFVGKKGVVVVSDVNPTGKRRFHGIDLNRHFGLKNSLPIEDTLLTKITELKPRTVIALHEDDTTDEVYAYCSLGLVNMVKVALKSLQAPLAKSAIGDRTDEGVITHGHLPCRGTLEHELRHRHIENCTIETPAKKHSVHERVELHKHMVSALLKHIYPFS